MEEEENERQQQPLHPAFLSLPNSPVGEDEPVVTAAALGVSVNPLGVTQDVLAQKLHEREMEEGRVKARLEGSGGAGTSAEELPRMSGSATAIGAKRFRDGIDGDGRASHDHNDMLGMRCRRVESYERLNRIDEGTYGVVYRARDKSTGRVVALKRVKLEKFRDGFPLTSIREMKILLGVRHRNVVEVMEVVVGNNNKVFMVMEFVEHDLKNLMTTMKHPFSRAEVKCLMRQLLDGVAFLHDHWIIHRDLKTSNLLYNNRGQLKICDFGLARNYGSPLQAYTANVVTLWYRAPELLLGAKKYSQAIDCWSLGCIMAEFLSREPLLPGKSEIQQLELIFDLLGTPNDTVWEGFRDLPGAKKLKLDHKPYSQLRQRFPGTSFYDGRPSLTDAGFDVLSSLLAYDPRRRMTASHALSHRWFDESPPPQDEDLMPTFPVHAPPPPSSFAGLGAGGGVMTAAAPPPPPSTTTAIRGRGGGTGAHDNDDDDQNETLLAKRRRDELAEHMRAQEGGLFNFSL